MAKILITTSYLTFLLLALTFLFPSAYVCAKTTTTTTHKTSSTTSHKTTTTSTKLVTSTRSSSSSSSLPTPSLLTSLFPPVYKYTSGFTASSLTSTPAGISKIALSDSALNAIRISGPAHPVVTKAGKQAFQATYPAGSYSPSNTPQGGFTFYLTGPQNFASAIQAGAKEVVMGYSVMFEQGFQWVLGGKIPGICEFAIVTSVVLSVH